MSQVCDDTCTIDIHSLSRTAAQVVIRWTLQHEIALVVRSSKATHLVDNVAAMHMPPLSQDAFLAMNQLDGWSPPLAHN